MIVKSYEDKISSIIFGYIRYFLVMVFDYFKEMMEKYFRETKEIIQEKLDFC